MNVCGGVGGGVQFSSDRKKKAREAINTILQVRILERVAISFSRGSSWGRDENLASRLHISWIGQEHSLPLHHLWRPVIKYMGLKKKTKKRPVPEGSYDSLELGRAVSFKLLKGWISGMKSTGMK